MTADGKLEKLRAILKDMQSALLAFSGGVDSTFLLAVAADTLKSRVRAVTIDSVVFTRAELRRAKTLARDLGVRHQVVAGAVPREFWRNSPQRCYFCKKRLFGQLLRVARASGLRAVIDASHADDSGEYRPGARALAQLGIRSPLAEAGLTKHDIRRLSRALGLATWNAPSMACLASRIPYGERITPERLAMVERAEALLRRSGIISARVRSHGTVARIEVAQRDIPAAVRLRGKISAALKKTGFVYVSLDLDGYRSGSLNEVFKWKKKR
ncbi:MAG TPA: ATP-dependent sacrificial sulfur transferase LarE [Candidatus Omnitrophota bacterium]|nr:ATP-dependent sacrificial sulfur transferase LarE [Candidatus Omnitrophota bacterium]